MDELDLKQSACVFLRDFLWHEIIIIQGYVISVNMHEGVIGMLNSRYTDWNSDNVGGLTERGMLWSEGYSNSTDLTFRKPSLDSLREDIY